MSSIHRLTPALRVLSFSSRLGLRRLSTRPPNSNAGAATGATEPAHTTDTYSREVDATPPPPDTRVHRVDPEAGDVQRAQEPPAPGVWTQAGANAGAGDRSAGKRGQKAE